MDAEVIITTVLFDDKYELLHNRFSIHDIAPLTEKEYFVRGSTALLDAVGKTVNKIKNILINANEDERPEHVMFVITTDGMENSSREFSYEKVRQMIEHQKNEGWEFIFLGAIIDAVATAEMFGIDKDRASNYHADSEGTLLSYNVISETIHCLQVNHKISENWKKRIEDDYKKKVIVQNKVGI